MGVVHSQFLCTQNLADLKEQHICIEFCFQLGKYATETFEVWKVAFGEQTVGRPQIFEWFSKFRNGVIYTEDAECHGTN